MIIAFRSCPLNASYVDDIVNKFELCFSTNLTRPLQLLVQSNAVSQSCLLHVLSAFRTSTGIEVDLQIYNASIAASQAVQELQVRDEWVVGTATGTSDRLTHAQDVTAFIHRNIDRILLSHAAQPSGQ